jgi:hypothetical protein
VVIVAATSQGVELVADGAARRTLDADVRCLAADGSRLWAGTSDDGVRVSDDRGETWLDGGLAGAAVRSLAVDGSRIYAGLRPAAVWRNEGGDWQPLAAFPRRRRWFWWSPAEKPYHAYVLGLAAKGDVLLAGIEAGAVLRSAGGEMWSGHRRGASRDCHGLWIDEGRAYAVGGTRPLVVSDDLGSTWRSSRAGLAGRYGWSAVSHEGHVYLAAAPLRRAHSADAGAWIHRGDGVGPWTRVVGPVQSLPRLGAGGGLLVYAHGPELRESRDGGQSWSELGPRLSGPARALLVL